MRFHETWTPVLGNGVRVDLLRVLVLDPERELTGRELARRVRASPSQVNEQLGRLFEEGLLTKRGLGRAHGWRISSAHHLFEPLRRLFAEEPASLDRLREELRSTLEGLPVERAVIFGSVARGGERAGSDIDLFIQTRTSQEKATVLAALVDASHRFSLQFGNSLAPLVLSRTEVRRAPNRELFREVDRDEIMVVR